MPASILGTVKLVHSSVALDLTCNGWLPTSTPRRPHGIKGIPPSIGIFCIAVDCKFRACIIDLWIGIGGWNFKDELSHADGGFVSNVLNSKDGTGYILIEVLRTETPYGGEGEPLSVFAQCARV